MRHFPLLAFGLALSATAFPAMAQMGPSMGGNLGGGKAPQPLARTPDIAPSALPGVGGAAPLATGPQMQKLTTGDPTTALFAAVNNGDYNAAQDAISRGADLNAQNAFGETPLDLSIALNRNTITFLLLETRNELQAQNGGGPVGAPWSLTGAAPVAGFAGKSSRHVEPPAAAPRAVPVSAGPGTPNPDAGFLGFGSKN